jgi:hypothetical protein
MIALVNATAENARLLREMAQHNQDAPPGNQGRYKHRNETTYVDFTHTWPPVFTRADKPLEADDCSVPWSKSLTSLIVVNTRSRCLQPNSFEVLQERGGETILLHSQLVTV